MAQARSSLSLPGRCHGLPRLANSGSAPHAPRRSSFLGQPLATPRKESPRLQHRVNTRCLHSSSHLRQSAAIGHRTLPAWFVRGGTSNGLVIHRRHLPPEDQWHTVLPAAMGSPDPNGRQLNGMGSGISSTSKIVILGPPSRPDVDVDFTFVQLGIRDGSVDMAGNCGNMSSVVGPAAWDQGLVRRTDALEQDEQGLRWASVRFLNTNTNKVMLSRFRVEGSPPMYCEEGSYVLDGVPGANSPITLSFLDPAGAKTGQILPTGNPVDDLIVADGRRIRASLVDVGNPGVFVHAGDIGADDPSPASIEAQPQLKARLEEIRQAGAAKMGLDPLVGSVPKIVLLLPQPPRGSRRNYDVACLAMSMGQAHKAVPLTLALCLGAACRVPGTLAADLAMPAAGGTVTIGHPGGRLEVGTTWEDGRITSAQLLRTARWLMQGQVFY